MTDAFYGSLKEKLPTYIEKDHRSEDRRCIAGHGRRHRRDDEILSRAMQWQGMSFWMTMRRGPTMPGKLFFTEELAGPLCPDTNFDLCLSINR